MPKAKTLNASAFEVFALGIARLDTRVILRIDEYARDTLSLLWRDPQNQRF